MEQRSPQLQKPYALVTLVSDAWQKLMFLLSLLKPVSTTGKIAGPNRQTGCVGACSSTAPTVKGIAILSRLSEQAEMVS